MLVTAVMAIENSNASENFMQECLSTKSISAYEYKVDEGTESRLAVFRAGTVVFSALSTLLENEAQ